MAVNKVIYGNTTLIDLTSDTITAGDLAQGVIAHDKSGAVIAGTNTYDADTSDADVLAGEILATKVAYANGNKITGSMPNQGGVSGTISNVSTPYTISAGYHDGSGTVGIDSAEASKLIASNIKKDITILGVTGEYGGESVTAQTKSATPSTTAQTILPDTGYDYLSQVDIAAIPYSEVANPFGTTVIIGASS